MTTTVRLDETDYQALKVLGRAVGMSVNRLIQESVSLYLREYRRLVIDKEFEGMATDSAYQKMSIELAG
jgi:hypothetical protein